MGFFSNDFLTLIPEIFLVFSICGLLVFGGVYSTKTLEKTSSSSSPILIVPVLWLGVQILFLTTILTFNSQVLRASLFFSSLGFDSLSLGSKALVYFFAGLCLLASKEYLQNQGILAFEYVILILLSSLGLSLMILSKDLLSFYLSLELQALSLYVLASFKRSSAFSTEAGIKYFIIGAFASGLTLFGISLIFGSTATTNFENLERLSLCFSQTGGLDMPLLFLIGLVFLTAGIFFKLAAAPFHMWIADVYEGAPTASTIFFAVVPKIGILALFLKLYFTAFYGGLVFWQNFVILTAVLSMIIGSFAALYQRKLKRFLAYSAIGQVGFMLVGLAVANFEGLEAVLLYVIIYSLMGILVWTALLSTETLSKSQFKAPIIYIDELVYVGRLNPSFSFSLGVVFFSMAGVPPLAGFFSKFYIFLTAVESSFNLLALIGLLTSVLSAFYYLRWLKFLYFEKTSFLPYAGIPANITSYYNLNISREKGLILSFTTFFLISFFLYPAPLFLFVHWMSLALVLFLENLILSLGSSVGLECRTEDSKVGSSNLPLDNSYKFF